MWKSAWLRMLCMQSTIAASAQVFAQSPSDADFCREGSFPREQESLNVAVLPASPVRQGADWAGIWVYGPDRIRISSTKRKGELRMRSNLRWEGGILPNGEALAHFGGMTGTLDIDGSRASAAEGKCRVGLTRIGRYLVADDNGACGALNVRHTGMYVRQSK